MKRRFWATLAPFLLLAIGGDLFGISRIPHPARSVSIPSVRSATPAAAQTPVRSPAPIVLEDGKAALPDVADYETIIIERDGLDREASALLTTIGKCEHAAPDPYGTGLSVLNRCLAVTMRENMMRARFEPLLLLGALRSVGQGACLSLASGLIGALADLGDASSAFISDVGDPGPSQPAQERRDVRDLRQVADGIIVLARASGWRSACRPRPYDSAEHRTGAGRAGAYGGLTRFRPPPVSIANVVV